MIKPSALPEIGPLTRFTVYRREDLAKRFRGPRYQGIVPSSQEPVVLLFHTKEGTHQYYQDGFDDDGAYEYSGMGSKGDMKWNAANRAVRDHESDGRDLLFFERAQRKDGLWRFMGEMYCLGHKIDTRPDIEGKERKAIVFRLSPLDDPGAADTIPILDGMDLVDLRHAAMAESTGGTRQTTSNVRMRSAAVHRYALKRADGVCEACERPGPFRNRRGELYLEVHHVHRLADNGPDRPDAVAAICPNCHRRCHYGDDGSVFNGRLIDRILKLEDSLDLD